MTKKLLETINEWYTKTSNPTETGRKYCKCPVCHATWWPKDRELHNLWCWIPKLAEKRLDAESEAE